MVRHPFHFMKDGESREGRPLFEKPFIPQTLYVDPQLQNLKRETLRPKP